MIGAQQVAAILNDETLPFGKDLRVEVEDSAYNFPGRRKGMKPALRKRQPGLKSRDIRL